MCVCLCLKAEKMKSDSVNRRPGVAPGILHSPKGSTCPSPGERRASPHADAPGSPGCKSRAQGREVVPCKMIRPALLRVACVHGALRSSSVCTLRLPPVLGPNVRAPLGLPRVLSAISSGLFPTLPFENLRKCQIFLGPAETVFLIGPSLRRQALAAQPPEPSPEVSW